MDIEQYLKYEEARIVQAEPYAADIEQVLNNLRMVADAGGQTVAQQLTNLAEQRKCIEQIAALRGVMPTPGLLNINTQQL